MSSNWEIKKLKKFELDSIASLLFLMKEGATWEQVRPMFEHRNRGFLGDKRQVSSTLRQIIEALESDATIVTIISLYGYDNLLKSQSTSICDNLLYWQFNCNQLAGLEHHLQMCQEHAIPLTSGNWWFYTLNGSNKELAFTHLIRSLAETNTLMPPTYITTIISTPELHCLIPLLDRQPYHIAHQQSTTTETYIQDGSFLNDNERTGLFACLAHIDFGNATIPYLEPNPRYVFVDGANVAYRTSTDVRTQDIIHSLNEVAQNLTCLGYCPIIVLSYKLTERISKDKDAKKLKPPTITSPIDGVDDYIVVYCALLYNGMIFTNDQYNWSWLTSHHCRSLIESLSIRYCNTKVYYMPTPRIILVNPTHVIFPIRYTQSVGKPNRSPPTMTWIPSWGTARPP